MALEQSVEQFVGKARLPNFAFPKSYDLHLKPDLTACTFSGVVRISVDVVSATRFLVLNAADLAIAKSSVLFVSSKELRASKITVVEADEILVVQFDDFLSLGEGVLEISFEGTLNDQMKGFYRSTYEHNGEKKNMAVTQFEPTDARRCFPCWDEPAFKFAKCPTLVCWRKRRVRSMYVDEVTREVVPLDIIAN